MRQERGIGDLSVREIVLRYAALGNIPRTASWPGVSLSSAMRLWTLADGTPKRPTGSSAMYCTCRYNHCTREYSALYLYSLGK